jgi:hypothetical protein
VYRDSFFGGQARDTADDVENNSNVHPGWFSEGSVQSIIYDVFDMNADAGDAVALGFGPIHAAMTNELKHSPAFTSIYVLMSALRTRDPGSASALTQLASAQGIALGAAGDDFGAAETNDGGDPRNLPVYTVIAPGETRQVCSTATEGVYNKLGNRRLLRLDLAARQAVRITASSTVAGGDPDIVLYRDGVEVARAEALGNDTLTATASVARPYIIEVYEAANVVPNSPVGSKTTCIDVGVN